LKVLRRKIGSMGRRAGIWRCRLSEAELVGGGELAERAGVSGVRLRAVVLDLELVRNKESLGAGQRGICESQTLQAFGISLAIGGGRKDAPGQFGAGSFLIWRYRARFLDLVPRGGEYPAEDGHGFRIVGAGCL